VRREMPIAITFVVGVIMLLSNFITVPLGGNYSLAALAQELGGWGHHHLRLRGGPRFG
jgi:hypothetical protein